MIKKIVASSNIVRRYRSTPKRVGLELYLQFILNDDVKYCSQCANRDNVHRDWGVVTGNLPYSIPYGTRVGTSWERCETHGETASFVTNVSVSFFISADRPKEIVSESRAMGLIAQEAKENEDGGHMDLHDIISQRVGVVQERFEADIKTNLIKDQANELIRHLASEARKEAKKITSFNKKLDDLKAEFEKVQLDCLNLIIIDELNEMVLKSDKVWETRAVALAAEFAKDGLEVAIPSIFGRSAHTEIIKMENVYPKEKEKSLTP